MASNSLLRTICSFKYFTFYKTDNGTRNAQKKHLNEWNIRKTAEPFLICFFSSLNEGHILSKVSLSTKLITKHGMRKRTLEWMRLQKNVQIRQYPNQFHQICATKAIALKNRANSLDDPINKTKNSIKFLKWKKHESLALFIP